MKTNAKTITGTATILGVASGPLTVQVQIDELTEDEQAELQNKYGDEKGKVVAISRVERFSPHERDGG